MTCLTLRPSRAGLLPAALLLASLCGCGGGGTSAATPSTDAAALGSDGIGATAAGEASATLMATDMPPTQTDEPGAVSPLLQSQPDAGELPTQQIAAADEERLIPVAPNPAQAHRPLDPTIASVVATGTARRSLSRSDILTEMNPANSFRSLGWKWSVQCGGHNVGVLDVPETGLTLDNLDDSYGALRFGKVADPAETLRKVMFFRAKRSDPLLHGAPRCEAGSSPTAGGAIPVGTPVWFAFGLRLHEWTATPDEQIVMQWHHGDGSVALNPFVALSVMGSNLRVMARYNNSQVLSKATTTAMELSSKGPLPVDQWSYFVVKALISPDGSLGSYLQVWRDGVMTVNYRGPLGYNNPQFQPYVKVGHYHWNDRINQWPSTTPVRTVMMRTPVLVQDVAGRYGERDLRAHVIAR